MAGHDLKEPLKNGDKLPYAVGKEIQGPSHQNAQEYIHFAVDGGTRMRELIDDLLEYSKIDMKAGSSHW